MSNKKFPGDLKRIDELESNQKDFLIEHYKRTEAFWRHWTPTLWSIPSIAAAINIGAYSLIFDSSKNLEAPIKVIVLIILVSLNFALTIGAWKHRYMQKEFGDRLQDIKKYALIPPVELTTIQKKISASRIYVIVMLIILIISVFLLICSTVCIICPIMSIIHSV